MYWSLNKISVYGDRVHGEAVHASHSLISQYQYNTMQLHLQYRNTVIEYGWRAAIGQSRVPSGSGASPTVCACLPAV